MALSQSVKVPYAAVGMPYFFISSLEKALLLSMTAARRVGPKHGMPISLSLSVSPIANGSSGMTAAKSIGCVLAKPTMPSISVAGMGTHSASSAMPPFPGRA